MVLLQRNYVDSVRTHTYGDLRRQANRRYDYFITSTVNGELRFRTQNCWISVKHDEIIFTQYKNSPNSIMYRFNDEMCWIESTYNNIDTVIVNYDEVHVDKIDNIDVPGFVAEAMCALLMITPF